MIDIRKFFLFATFGLILSFLSATSVMAATPGCDPDFRKVQESIADAKRIERKAYAHQIMKRPDPSLGMTCFDMAMGVTARLGNIFSDVVSAPPPYNTAVFTAPIFDTSFGAGKYLAKEMNNVITPTLNQYLGNFNGTISSFLGATVGDALDSVMGPIDTAISDITSAISSLSGDITALMGQLNTVITIANNLGVALPQAAIAALSTMLDTVLTAINAAMASIQAAMNAAISTILSTITDFINNVLGDLLDTGCDRMSQLWNDGDPTNSVPSIEGSGIEPGTPYFALDDLLTGTPAGAGAEMLVELATSYNSTVLSDALNNMTNFLGAPGGMNSWKTAPVIPVAATVADIISQM